MPISLDPQLIEYRFPVILHINDVLPHIDGREEFRAMDRGDHITVDYLFVAEDTFPAIYLPGYDNRRNTVLRECRGLVFDKATGVIIRRGPQKFFNYEERTETKYLPLDKGDFVWMEKLDGSLVAPFKPTNGRLIWGTMAGETDYSEFVNDYVAKNPQYIEVANFLIDNGWTPSFEYCSRRNKVVIDHPFDRLVLHTVRNIISGEYLPYEQMKAFETYGIEVAEKLPLSFDEVLSNMDTAEGIEGYILRFASGHMVKFKTEWYRLLHGCVTGIRFEKDALKLILGGMLDDAKAFMPEDLLNKIEKHSDDVYEGLLESTEYIVKCVWEAEDDGLDRKAVAARFKDDPYFHFIMPAYDDLIDMANRREKMSDTLGTMTFRRLQNTIYEKTWSQTWVDRYRFLYGNKRLDLHE